MADMMQNDPNSALGQIQALLGNYGVSPDERKKAVERRDLAQQQYLGVLQEPMPDQGAINRMVNDYLMRYAKQPNLPAHAAIAAIGAEGQRSQEMAQNQLLRRQLAAEQEAKMAGEALKEADVFGKGLLGTKAGGAQGSLSFEQRMLLKNADAINSAVKKAFDERSKKYPNDTANMAAAIEEVANDLGTTPEQIRSVFKGPTSLPGGSVGVVQPTGAMTTTQPTVLATGAPTAQEEFDLGKIKTAGAEKSNRLSDRNFILQQEWDTQQQIIDRFGLQSPQGQAALAEQAKIKGEMRKGDTAAPAEARTTAPAAPYVSQSASGFSPWATFEPIDTRKLLKPQSEALHEELKMAKETVLGKESVKRENALKSIRDLMNSTANINLETDKLTPVKTIANQFARALGAPLTDASGKEITDYAQLKQALTSTGLQMQLEQVGVQTDPDFQRNLATAFDPTTDQKTRAVLVRNLLERVNRQYGELAFTKEALGGTNALGRVAEIPQRYRQMVNTTGLPESVGVKKGGKYQYVPINEAIEMYHSTSKGKEYAFDKSDSSEERQKKLTATIQALKQMHTAVESHFDRLGQSAATQEAKRGLVK